jgi:hypothetical protein
VVERTRSRVVAVMPSQSLCDLSGLLTAARRRAEHVGKRRRMLATVTVRPVRVVRADVWGGPAMQS